MWGVKMKGTILITGANNEDSKTLSDVFAKIGRK